MLDMLIRGGLIVDGSGAAPQKGDLAIQDGKILAMGPSLEGEALEEIDASGRIVAPGFVDIHRHADLAILDPGFGETELRQGITTIVNGNCGLSAAPCPAACREEILSAIGSLTGRPADPEGVPQSFGEYLEALKARPLPVNAGMLVGNGTVRAATTGFSANPLTAKDREQIAANLDEALTAGALGVSMGLIYAPECYYTFEELVQVLRPARKHQVPLVTHIRGEGDTSPQALEEVIRLAETLEVPLHVSHLKRIGRRNWGAGLAQSLEILRKAQERGLPLSYDVYPYTAGSTQLAQILPPAFQKGGPEEMVGRLRSPEKRRALKAVIDSGPSEEFDNIVDLLGWDSLIISSLRQPENQQYVGLSVAEIAARRGQDPFDCACDLLIEENGDITMIDYLAAEEDVKTILKDPNTSLISDALYAGGKPHPRLYGAFPRLLCQYVREEKVLSLETAIHKMTAQPAEVFRLKKGRIAAGEDGDLVIFRLENLSSPATYDQPRQLAGGLDYVMVGGRTVVKDDRLTGEKPGKAIVRENRIG